MYKRWLPFFVLVLLSITHFSSFGQNVAWSKGRQITWSDFQGTPDAGSSYYAYTATRTTYKSQWDADGNISVTVICEFNPSRSWKKQADLTDALLRHEQLHFDIAELFARKMRKEYATYCQTHKASAEAGTDLDGIFKRAQEELRKYQDAYDTETDHSKNKPKQAEWDKKITNELKELDSYATK